MTAPLIKTKKNRLLTVMLLGMALLAGIGCSGKKNEKDPPADNSTAAQEAYEILEVVLQEIPEKIHAVGTVRAYREVEITPEISGKVKSIHAGVGDSVSQGMVLAEIDNEARIIALEKKKAQLLKAEAALKKTSKDAGKSYTLFSQGVISDSESDDAGLQHQISDADLMLARAEVRAAQKELRDTKITAPFDGKIALENVELGKYVLPGQNLFTLVDMKTVTIDVNLSELDISKIAVGDAPQVVLDSLENGFQGRVETIGLKADDSTRTFPVEIAVSNPQEQLLSGMVARVIFKPTVPQRAVLIPYKTVRPINGAKVVSVLKNGRAVQRVVQTGAVIGTDVVIKKGLVPGEKLIVSEGAAD